MYVLQERFDALVEDIDVHDDHPLPSLPGAHQQLLEMLLEVVEDSGE